MKDLFTVTVFRATGPHKPNLLRRAWRWLARKPAPPPIRHRSVSIAPTIFVENNAAALEFHAKVLAQIKDGQR